jgi:hypothetical protein
MASKKKSVQRITEKFQTLENKATFLQIIHRSKRNLKSNLEIY